MLEVLCIIGKSLSMLAWIFRMMESEYLKVKAQGDQFLVSVSDLQPSSVLLYFEINCGLCVLLL